MGAYEYLERQEGKIRKCLFFYVKILENNSVEGQGINENHILVWHKMFLTSIIYVICSQVYKFLVWYKKIRQPKIFFYSVGQGMSRMVDFLFWEKEKVDDY